MHHVRVRGCACTCIACTCVACTPVCMHKRGLATPEAQTKKFSKVSSKNNSWHALKTAPQTPCLYIKRWKPLKGQLPCRALMCAKNSWEWSLLFLVTWLTCQGCSSLSELTTLIVLLQCNESVSSEKKRKGGCEGLGSLCKPDMCMNDSAQTQLVQTGAKLCQWRLDTHSMVPWPSALSRTTLPWRISWVFTVAMGRSLSCSGSVTTTGGKVFTFCALCGKYLWIIF